MWQSMISFVVTSILVCRDTRISGGVWAFSLTTTTTNRAYSRLLQTPTSMSTADAAAPTNAGHSSVDNAQEITRPLDELPINSNQSDLTQQIVALNEEIAMLQQQSDWKIWYKTSAEKNYELEKLHAVEKEGLARTLQELKGRLDVATAEWHITETLLQQARGETTALQTLWNSARQRHLEEIKDMQDQLDREMSTRLAETSLAETLLQRTKQQSADELQRVQTVAAQEMETAQKTWKNRLDALESSLMHVRAELHLTEENLEDRRFRVRILEQEKRSLRTLARTAFCLIRERVLNNFDKLAAKKTQSRSKAFVPKNNKAALETTVTDLIRNYK